MLRVIIAMVTRGTSVVVGAVSDTLRLFFEIRFRAMFKEYNKLKKTWEAKHAGELSSNGGLTLLWK